MRICVAGAGALGCMIAARAHQAGETITLLARGPFGEALKAQGARVSGHTTWAEGSEAMTVVLEHDSLPHADAILLTGKAHHTAELLARLEPILDGAKVIASLQNGLGADELIQARVGPERAVGVTVSHGCTRIGAGEVHHAGLGEIRVGPATPVLPGRGHAGADRLASVFEAGGLGAQRVPDVRPWRWRKVAINAAINPIATLAGHPNGILLTHPGLEASAREVSLEVARVAQAAGVIGVDSKAWANEAIEVARRTASNTCSMLQDLQRSVPTEIMAITGAVASEGRRVGVPTPYCNLLTALVRAREGPR